MGELSDNERGVLLSFAARVDSNDPGAMNNLGVLYFRKGLYAEAIVQFKEALKIDPRFDLARENLQYLFSETGTEDPDVKRWRKEAEDDSDNVEALLNLGVSYQNMGRFNEAAETLGRVVEHKPDHTMARIHLGCVLKAQGLHQQALEHYVYVQDDVNKSAVFHTDLGEVYYNLGRTEEAISELRAAIKIDADYWRSHFLLSFAYGDNGNVQEALEESRVASRLNPSFQNTEANLTISDYGRGEGEEAIGGAKEIPSLESTSFTLGIAYRERGFFKEALKEFKKALEEMPDRDRVHIEVGKIHLAGDDLPKALKAFLKALEVNPESGSAYGYLGCVFHLQKEYNQAAACYLQAYRLDSADADAINNLGVLLYQVGLIEDAERMFKKGLNLKLYHTELNYNFLTSNILKEEYLMAENLIQRLEAFMGKSALLYEKRALLNYKLNRLTLALFDIESALSLDPNHSDALFLKGLIFLREEDLQGAINTIVDAAKIRKRYTGFDFLLSIADRQRTKPATVEKVLPFEPGDDLIELLNAGINRRFDMIREELTSIISRGANVEDTECEVEEKKDTTNAESIPLAEQDEIDPLAELKGDL
ncbi:MAG: tetratricopeptide repeat protein [bacterium]|nr:MAG: tetratricopeptide repeat protein [bacterium]